MTISVIGLSIDCADPAAVARFWSEVLGRPVNPGASVDGAAIDASAPENGPRLTFHKVPEPKTVKNRLHLDLRTSEFEAESERLIGLGANAHTGHREAGGPLDHVRRPRRQRVRSGNKPARLARPHGSLRAFWVHFLVQGVFSARFRQKSRPVRRPAPRSRNVAEKDHNYPFAGLSAHIVPISGRRQQIRPTSGPAVTWVPRSGAPTSGSCAARSATCGSSTSSSADLLKCCRRRGGQPFLVLHGGAGPQSLAAYGQAYAAAIPRAHFQVLPATGHVPQMETPGLVLEAIWDWGLAPDKGSVTA